VERLFTPVTSMIFTTEAVSWLSDADSSFSPTGSDWDAVSSESVRASFKDVFSQKNRTPRIVIVDTMMLSSM